MSLYRKYRPLLFADIAGQEHIKQTLQRAIVRNELVHAYLFSGPRAVGKTTTARILTRAVNCAARASDQSEPCNRCDACMAILENRALDVIEIDAASHTGVDNVRDTIIAAARVGRAGLAKKVFIIDEVHMLSTSAFNALLKILEEPPAQVLFILATTELHKVPATIASRCQRFDFKRIAPDVMRARLKRLIGLEKKNVTDDVVDTIVRLSDGCLRDAESLLGQVLVLGDKKIDRDAACVILPIGNLAAVKDLIAALLAVDGASALRIINDCIERDCDLSVFTADTLEYFRTLLLIQSGTPELVGMSESELRERTGQAARITSERLLAIIGHFSVAQRDVRYFSIPQLPIEVAIVKSCLYTDAHQ
ncbi:DNA polymerase III subunit gamma/tau [Candidatus Uhrbacteria bacterium]|nr:DNA polymerase III subunit gamma/tau [Candidatus Uhrbacteria bacterium]